MDGKGQVHLGYDVSVSLIEVNDRYSNREYTVSRTLELQSSDSCSAVSILLTTPGHLIQPSQEQWGPL